MSEAFWQELQQRFSNYVAGYYSHNEEENQAISLKRDHTQRVCANARMLSARLQVSGPDARLAQIMALFHDIGRFKQYKEYKTFKDADSENHARLSVSEIKRHDLLRGLPDADAALVLTAIFHHNVYALPAGLDSRERFFLKLLRDADKLDIWKVFIEYCENRAEGATDSVSLGLPDAEGCSRAVLDCLRSGRLVRMQDLAGLNDFKLLQAGWVYDLNFAPTVEAMLNRGYLERLQALLPRTPEMEDIFARLFHYARGLLQKAGC
ncbi:MAG TPA: HD domain-containing protein [Desulfosalsimonadaceae bacterium]|nr:HD domain-containing protein [Desulfosalsimonadaceae bacterium]